MSESLCRTFEESLITLDMQPVPSSTGNQFVDIDSDWVTVHGAGLKF